MKAHPRKYDTTNRNFTFVEHDEMEGFFNIYQVKTNLRVGVLDASEAEIRFTDSTKGVSWGEVKELFESAKEIQPNYQD